MRRFSVIALLAAGLIATGCTPVMQASLDTAGIALRKPAPLEFTRAQAARLPYALLRMDSGRYGSAVMILGRTVDGELFWAASSGQVLVERDGLVRRLTGFPVTLEGTRFVGADPFAAGLHRLAAGTKAHRIIDWMPGHRYGIELDCEFSVEGTENIEILGDTFHTLHVVERLRAKNMDFAATNHYWVDPTRGAILKSEQQLTPDLRVTLTALRPWRREGA